MKSRAKRDAPIVEAALCPLCDSGNPRRMWESSGVTQVSADQAFLCTTTERIRPEILECVSCSHVFSNPASWPPDLEQEYEVLVDQEYLRMLPVKRRTFSRAADVLQRHLKPPASILEVGSYAGLFLAECRSRGYEVVGIEPSAWGAQVAGQEGLRVIQGTAEHVLNGTSLGEFDAVVSWDVLEHVKDPTQFISLLSSRVRQGGFVVISTLDRTNWFARLMGKRWPWYIPMHLHYFDQESVLHMASTSGLNFIETAPHVHYTSGSYALQRLLRHGDTIKKQRRASLLERWIFPVGFGDVRLYVFESPR